MKTWIWILILVAVTIAIFFIGRAIGKNAECETCNSKNGKEVKKEAAPPKNGIDNEKSKT